MSRKYVLVCNECGKTTDRLYLYGWLRIQLRQGTQVDKNDAGTLIRDRFHDVVDLCSWACAAKFARDAARRRAELDEGEPETSEADEPAEPDQTPDVDVNTPENFLARVTEMLADHANHMPAPEWNRFVRDLQAGIDRVTGKGHRW